jgi:ABC-2 type transport system permease protein
VRNALAIATREIRSYFVSPVAYVVLTGFLLLSGWFFFNLLARFSYLVQVYSGMQSRGGGGELERLNLNDFVISPLLHNLSVVLVILIPVITMRTFAEEKRLGTFELLLTSPLRVGEIVAGKFLGAMAFVSIMLAGTLVYPALLLIYGNPEPWIMISGYIGLFFVAATYLSIGLLTSSVTENQIIAAVSCLVALLLLYVINWPADTSTPTLGALLHYLSVTEHFGEFVKGVIDSRAIVYFLSVISAALFLTHRSIESLRWR